MSDKKKTLKPRLPRGLADREADNIRAIDGMVRKITAVYERYGFDPVETPLIEYTDALGKFLPDTDRPNEGVFSFQDDDESWLSLRYDLTAPLARYFAENYDRLPKPYRSYRAGWVFRNEKPGPGRFRQFMQLDADTVGSSSPAADAEMAMMMADVMKALGFEFTDYVVKISHRKILDGILEAIGLSGDDNEGRRLTVLRAIDKFDRLGPDGVRSLLSSGRKDESGAWTKGADLRQDQADEIVRILGAGLLHSMTGGAYLFKQAVLSSFRVNEHFEQGFENLEAIEALCRAAGYSSDLVRVDTSVVRGLEYYTGAVFEIEFRTFDENAVPTSLGSVGGGGRYDGLVSRFRSEPVPATGFSIGVSRLAEALRLTGNLATDAATGPVVVLVMDRDQMAGYQQMVAELRNANIRAELFLGNPKNFGKQLAYADQRNSPAAIIEGGDERAAGTVQIKDLIAGKRAAASIEDNEAWRAERPGQFSVPRAELVARIKELLAKQSRG